MKKQKFFLCLLAVSVLFAVLSGCQTTEIPEDDPDWIVGNWTTVVREDDREHGEVMSIVTEFTYTFLADGNGCINDSAWISHPGTDWEIAGKGYVETYFAYTLEGNILTITHTGNEFEEYPEEEQETIRYTIVRNADGTVIWAPEDGGNSRTHRKGTYDLPVEDLLILYGLNPSPLEE